jgi:hypothetical protein
MRAYSTRQPNLGDVMILVVACAVAMAIMKQADPLQSLQATLIPPSQTTMSTSLSLSLDVWVLLWIERWISPMLVTLAVAILVIRLRRPRPSFRQLWQRPGVLALALSILVMIFVSLLALVRYLVHETGLVTNLGLMIRFSDVFRETAYYGGALTLGSWLTLAFSRRFRCTRDWIEQVSILLGSCWIAAFLIQLGCYRIFGFLI